MHLARWLAGAVLVTACSSGSSSGSADAGDPSDAGVDRLVDGSTNDGDLIPAPDGLGHDAPDHCETALAHGATSCEAGPGTLEYCVPEPEAGGCPELVDAPRWVFELLIDCWECEVSIRTATTGVDGSCCYVAENHYVGP